MAVGSGPWPYPPPAVWESLVTLTQSWDRDYPGSSSKDNQIAQETPWHCLINYNSLCLKNSQIHKQYTFLKLFDLSSKRLGNPETCLFSMRISLETRSCISWWLLSSALLPGGRKRRHQPALQESPFCHSTSLAFKHYGTRTVTLLPHD